MLVAPNDIERIAPKKKKKDGCLLTFVSGIDHIHDDMKVEGEAKWINNDR